MYKSRYIYDALYGPIRFPDYVWRVLSCPELQRLREVRLCNINSLCLPGGANVNRYEHALGTAHLALQWLDASRACLDEETRRRLVLAALMHDTGSAAFGHSTQYVLGPQGYEHESLYDMFSLSPKGNGTGYAYQHTRVQPIFFGIPRHLASLMEPSTFAAMCELVDGKGTYGPLINGTMDLDNIDNVFRLAYHVGIVRDGETPLRLARALRISEKGICIERGARRLVEKWYNVRRVLYQYLLLNPDEFSAKCMLQDALEIAQQKSEVSFYWHDVDFQLLEKLCQCSSDSAAIVRRLMLGDLYGCAGLYSTTRTDAAKVFASHKARARLEHSISEYLRNLSRQCKGRRFEAKSPGRQALERSLYDAVTGKRPFKRPPRLIESSLVALHGILDVNKTQRRVSLREENGDEVVIGSPTKRLLVGIFFRNADLNMEAINEELLIKWGVRELVMQWFRQRFSDPAVLELVPYAETEETEGL
jgi:hypothetical protein